MVALAVKDSQPRVTIGMPVRNGERFIGEAIESLLAQEFGDFELRISDNASKDATGEICRRYMKQDPRISYSCELVDAGAIANFNRLAALCETDLFMWAAHDDLWEPGFLASCIGELDRNPGAPLACTNFNFVNEDGSWRSTHVHSPNLAGHRPSKRLGAAVSNWGWMSIYGLFRTQALKKTDLLRTTIFSDVLLMAQMSLEGSFAVVPAALFSYRLKDISGRSSAEAVAATLAPGNLIPTQHPTTELFLELLTLPRSSIASRSERALMYRELRKAATRRDCEFFNWRPALLDELKRDISTCISANRLSRLPMLAVRALLVDPKLAVSISKWTSLRPLTKRSGD